MSGAKVFRATVVMSSERFEPTISRRLCRNLFGPVDHDQLQSEQQSELKRIDNEKQKRWNFDFVKFRPLHGDFVWQRIGEEQSTALTTITTETESSCHRNTSIEYEKRNTTTTDKASPNDERRQTRNVTEMCMKTPERSTTKPRRRSARITDYLREKRKPSVSRKIKFNNDEVDTKKFKQVQARRLVHRGRITKQSTLDELLPKLRPRHATRKTSS